MPITVAFIPVVNVDHASKKETYLNLMQKAYQRDRDQHILDLLLYLKYFMNHEEYCVLIDGIINLLNKVKSDLPPLVFDCIRSKMGIKRIDDLGFLKSNPNAKIYHRFGESKKPGCPDFSSAE